MATNIKGATIASTYDRIVVVDDDGVDINSGTATKNIEIQTAAGASTATPLHISTNRIGIGEGSPGSTFHIVGDLQLESTSDAADVTGGFVTMSNDNQTSSNGTFRYEDRFADQNNPSFIWNVADTGSNQLAYNFLNGDTSAFNIRQSRRVCINNTSDIAAQLLIKNSDDSAVDTVQCLNDNGVKHIALTQHSDGHGQIDVYKNDTTHAISLRSHANCWLLERLGLGTNDPAGKLHIMGAGAAANMYADAYSEDGDGPNFILRKSRHATVGSQTAPSSGDRLGQIYFQGTDGDSWEGGGSIRVLTTENWSGGSNGAKMEFYTAVNSGAGLHLRMTIGQDGKVSIGNESVPDSMLCINQSADDGKILSFKSSDIAHGLTGQAETDTYFSMEKAAGATGGILMKSIGDGSARSAFRMSAYSQGAPDETNSTSGFGEFACKAYRHDGSNNETTHGADANLLSVHNGADAKFLVKGDGDFYYDGTDQGAYDTYNDAQLVRAFDLSHGINVINNKFDEFVEYNSEKLAELKLIGKEDDGTPNHFVNVTGMQRLHNGAIWQQYTEMQRMKELMYDTMVELLGKEKANAKLEQHEVNLLKKDLLN